MPWKITTSGGGTYQGIAAYIVILFTRFGLFIAIYILIGVFHNTAPFSTAIQRSAVAGNQLRNFDVSGMVQNGMPILSTFCYRTDSKRHRAKGARNL